MFSNIKVKPSIEIAIHKGIQLDREQDWKELIHFKPKVRAKSLEVEVRVPSMNFIIKIVLFLVILFTVKTL